jgi:L-lactate dehydrogenase complex protein LldE
LLAMNSIPTLRPWFFATCLVDSIFPQVGRAALEVLQIKGLKPRVPLKQVCCGQSLYKAGQVDAARRVARAWVQTFSGAAAIVSPSGSCVAHVRHNLPSLLEPWPESAAQAKNLAARTFELSQFLFRIMGLESTGVAAPAEPWTYHPSCGLHRILGENKAPYRLLDGLEGQARLELPDAERCCGFGGPFSVSHPEISNRLLQDKLQATRQAGADVLVVGDVGCFMHLSCGAAKSDPNLKLIHLAQALAGEGA